MEFFDRTELLIGKESLNKLNDKKIAVFGVGGVGGFAVESLVRSGIKHITLIDSDTVAESNLNRQIIALKENIGTDKVEAFYKRIKSIREDAEVRKIKLFYSKENADEIDLSEFDYIVDAIDSVSSKIELIRRATKLNVPIISSMGTGGKLKTECLKIADISETKVCPLARVVRRELKKLGIERLKTVYSEEIPVKAKDGGNIPSMIFVPAVAGLMMAREVVLDLIKG